MTSAFGTVFAIISTLTLEPGRSFPSALSAWTHTSTVLLAGVERRVDERDLRRNRHAAGANEVRLVADRELRRVGRRDVGARDHA